MPSLYSEPVLSVPNGKHPKDSPIVVFRELILSFRAHAGSWWWTGKPGVLKSRGRKESDTTKRLNWAEGLRQFTWCLCLVAQSCPTPCNPVDCSLPGFSDHGTLQARILEWVAIPFPRGSSRPQGLNPTLWCLLHCRQILSLPSHQGSPIHMVEWLQVLRLLQEKMAPRWSTPEDILPTFQCRTSEGASVGGRTSTVFLKNLHRVEFLLSSLLASHLPLSRSFFLCL